MALRFVALMSLFVLPALASSLTTLSDSSSSPFEISGRIFCDTCQAGFETAATTYVEGARVKLECRDTITNKVTYRAAGVTDHTGTYKISAAGEHGNELCEMVLISSPQLDCNQIMPDRNRARVTLTHNNGIASNKRYANNLGFSKSTPMAGCTEVLKIYQDSENL